jgi:hypothetical protein
MAEGVNVMNISQELFTGIVPMQAWAKVKSWLLVPEMVISVTSIAPALMLQENGGIAG